MSITITHNGDGSTTVKCGGDTVIIHAREPAGPQFEPSSSEDRLPPIPIGGDDHRAFVAYILGDGKSSTPSADIPEILWPSGADQLPRILSRRGAISQHTIAIRTAIGAQMDVAELRAAIDGARHDGDPLAVLLRSGARGSEHEES